MISKDDSKDTKIDKTLNQEKETSGTGDLKVE